MARTAPHHQKKAASMRITPFIILRAARVAECTRVFAVAEARGEKLATSLSTMQDKRGAKDFAAFFPMVIPRAVMPTVRRLVMLAQNASYFDAAWAQMRKPSHLDLIGKTLALVLPHLAHVVHCSQHATGHDGAPSPCRDKVFNTEHAQHPIAGAHDPSLQRTYTREKAARYVQGPLAASRKWQDGTAPLPRELFLYQMHRNASAVRAVEDVLFPLQPQRSGMLCGVPRRPQLQPWSPPREHAAGGIDADAIRERANASWVKTRECASPGSGRWRYRDGFKLWHAAIPHLQRAMSAAPQGGEGGQSLAKVLKEGEIYAFGVAHAGSIPVHHREFPERRIYGFDSFAGLPPEQGSQESKISTWRTGQFRPNAANTPERIEALGGGKATIYKGFFNETMTATLAKAEGMRPAFFVDVDCDLFISTHQALDWLFLNGLLKVGTLVGYDDWWTVPCHKRFLSRGAGFRPPGTGINIDPLDVAEGLAHANIAQKYGVHFACVAGPCRMPPVAPAKCDILNNWAPIFVITRFATDGTYDTGFSFTKEERATWMDTRRPCQFVG